MLQSDLHLTLKLALHGPEKLRGYARQSSADMHSTIQRDQDGSPPLLLETGAEGQGH